MSTLSISNSSTITMACPATPSSAFSTILSGEHAFYNAADYLETTKRDFAATKALPPTYTYNTQRKVTRVAKKVLAVIIFPIGVYQLLHALAGKMAILPSSTPELMKLSKKHAHERRAEVELNRIWKYKRITIEVDGYKVDATIIGKASTLGNGRWVLASNGNGEFYEDKLTDNYEFKQILGELNSNAIVFNYPGVGSSSGMPNRQAMAKAYKAMLTFLEDEQKGIGAKEIIGYGHSIGGGVQGDALKNHKFKGGVKYVFVKSRTFSNLSKTAGLLTLRPVGLLVKALGWNLDSVKSSKKLQVPEIILQSANVQRYEELTSSAKIKDDGVIPAKASLAKALLDDQKCPKEKKIFIGIPENHNQPLWNPSLLVRKIEVSLAA